MMCNCFFGILISIILIATQSTNTFSVLRKMGVEIPRMRTIKQNSTLGIKAGVIGLVPVTFGAFCLNYTSIPLYLAFRRCGLLSSVIVMYFWAHERPSRGVLISTTLVALGAVIAAGENFDANLVGFLCVWAYNFSQSFQNVYLSVLNKGKVLTPFEFNFFFVCIGFAATAIYNFIITDDYKQLVHHHKDPQFQIMVFMFSSLSAIFSFSIAITVSVGGPLALNITGIIKDVFLTYAGFMFFDDV